MKKSLKGFLAVVSCVLVAVLAIGGTVAYLTSEDSAVNVMTLGNVAIDQIEQERDANGDLVEFNQAKKLYPAVYPGNSTSDSIPWADSAEWPVAGDAAWKTVQANKNVLDKFVTVKNVGESDAFIRTVIAFEGDPISGTDIHLVCNGDTAGKNGITWEFVENVTIAGVRYDVIVFTYSEALAADEVSIPSLKQVYMDHTCDNDDVAKYGDSYDILVLSQAVQTKGFANAKSALDTAFGAVTADSAAAWFSGEEFARPVLVSDGAALRAALAEGKAIIMTEDIEMEADQTAPYGNKYGLKMNGGVLDGGKNNLHIECHGDDYGIMTTGGTIKNVTIEEGCRAVMLMYAEDDVILDNVKLGGDGVLYPINTGEYPVVDGVDLIVTNSTLAGWTSFAGIESASFTKVTFEQGTYYNNIYGRVLKPMVNTTLTDCSFIEHMNMDLSGLPSGCKVIVENCTVAGQALTADKCTIPTTDAEYDTAFFTVDLPSWATSVNDCVIFK